MSHGTCAMHVPWCMSGSLTRGGGENVPGIPVACATRNFTYLVRGPCHYKTLSSGPYLMQLKIPWLIPLIYWKAHAYWYGGTEYWARIVLHYQLNLFCYEFRLTDGLIFLCFRKVKIKSMEEERTGLLVINKTLSETWIYGKKNEVSIY